MRYVLALFTALLVPEILYSQTAQAAALQTLTAELRQLRLAVERSAAATMRIQIAMQRLQLQEQRAERAASWLREARDNSTEYATHRKRMHQNLQEIDIRIGQEQDVTQRRALEAQRAELKSAIEHDSSLPDLQRREAEAASEARREQARVDELLMRLEALERAIPAEPR